MFRFLFRPHQCVIPFFFVLLSVRLWGDPAPTPAHLLIRQFLVIDSVFARSMSDINPVRTDSMRFMAICRELLHHHTGFYAFVVSDDAGRILKTIGYEELGSEFSGDCSQKEWSRKSRHSHEPFWGGLCRVNGRYCLVWSKPCLGKNMFGFTTCKGVVTALVNVGECLKKFSEEFQQPFELAQGKMIFFHSDDWRDGMPYHEQSLQLAEDFTLSLRFPCDTLGGIAPSSAAMAGHSTVPSLPEASRRAVMPSSTLSAGVFPVGWIIIFAIVFSVILCIVVRKRLFETMRWVRRLVRSVTPHEDQAPIEDRATVKCAVMNDLYAEIRSRVEKYEIAKIEHDVRERLRRDIKERLRAEITDAEREAIRTEVLEEERAALREAIVEELKRNESVTLRKKAREQLIERFEQEIEAEEAAVLRAELKKRNALHNTAPLDALALYGDLQSGPHLTVSTSSGTDGAAHQALKIEAVESLARTVSVLKDHKRGAVGFKLDETQTAQMIEYLEKISDRLIWISAKDAGVQDDPVIPQCPHVIIAQTAERCEDHHSVVVEGEHRVIACESDAPRTDRSFTGTGE